MPLSSTDAIFGTHKVECCSFFTFTINPADGSVQVDVEVPVEHTDVRDALADRSAAGMSA